MSETRLPKFCKTCGRPLAEETFYTYDAYTGEKVVQNTYLQCPYWDWNNLSHDCVRIVPPSGEPL